LTRCIQSEGPLHFLQIFLLSLPALVFHAATFQTRSAGFNISP
jgi:hypothetical protein